MAKGMGTRRSSTGRYLSLPPPPHSPPLSPPPPPTPHSPPLSPTPPYAHPAPLAPPPHAARTTTTAPPPPGPRPPPSLRPPPPRPPSRTLASPPVCNRWPPRRRPPSRPDPRAPRPPRPPRRAAVVLQRQRSCCLRCREELVVAWPGSGQSSEQGFNRGASEDVETEASTALLATQGDVAPVPVWEFYMERYRPGDSDGRGAVFRPCGAQWIVRRRRCVHGSGNSSAPPVGSLGACIRGRVAWCAGFPLGFPWWQRRHGWLPGVAWPA